MSPETTPLNPSQAVERIREIIVGRHLERLEQRVARLESPAPSRPDSSLPVEDRLLATEARLEALKENVDRITAIEREESRKRIVLQQEEIQRLAGQIQQVALSRSAPAADGPAIERLEQKLGHWLSTWRTSFQQHAEQRERQLARQLGDELAHLRESTEGRLNALQNSIPDTALIEERFKRIAAAARSLADLASSPLPPANADSPL